MAGGLYVRTKKLNTIVLSDAVRARSFTLGLLTISDSELYPLIPVSVTLTCFKGHSFLTEIKVKLADIFLVSYLFAFLSNT